MFTKSITEPTPPDAVPHHILYTNMWGPIILLRKKLVMLIV